MVKVGIITHHWVANFGANLQALASSKEFERQGAKVEIIDYHEPGWDEAIRTEAPRDQMRVHDDFVKQYYSLSTRINSLKELSRHCEKNYDIVVVGSDAMLLVDAPTDPFIILRSIKKREKLPPANLPGFWLNWNKGCELRTATMSVSAMGTNYPFIFGSLKRNMKHAISQFDFVGVRDDWTARMVKSLGRRDCDLYPDPVFSLLANIEIDKEKIVAKYGSLDDVILISGPIDEEWAQRFADAARKRGYRVAGIRIPEKEYDYNFTDINFNGTMSPLEWFGILGCSAGYVGIRFHALVSCMVQGVPVLNVDPHKKSQILPFTSKMKDMCDRANTSERFNTLSSLVKRSPDDTLDLLFDKKLLENANRYASTAGEKFKYQIARILELK